MMGIQGVFKKIWHIGIRHIIVSVIDETTHII